MKSTRVGGRPTCSSEGPSPWQARSQCKPCSADRSRRRSRYCAPGRGCAPVDPAPVGHSHRSTRARSLAVVAVAGISIAPACEERGACEERRSTRHRCSSADCPIGRCSRASHPRVGPTDNYRSDGRWLRISRRNALPCDWRARCTAPEPRSIMLIPVSQSRSHSLLLGSALLSMVASLGACATFEPSQRGFATAAVAESSQPARWGFATIAEPSPSTVHGFATISEPPQTERWGFVRLPAESRPELQASRPSAPTGRQP
jgi:hypothetical protein